MATATEKKPDVREVKVAELYPGDNYRKTFDKSKLAEMTASIKIQGIIQPIIVRKVGKKAGFEIVDGERRWRGAREAGRKTVPVIIKSLTDVEALEIALVANTQDEDANPMEEAIGFKRLLETGNHTTQTIHERTGKSVAYVMGRLKLNALPKEVQKKILDGSLGIGHAMILTRLRNAEDMKALAEEIIDNNLSVADADDELGNFSTAMRHAKFDTKSCATCPARSRAQTLLFPEAAKEDDFCFDRSCFLGKNKEHVSAFAADLEKSGIKVITDEKKARELMRAKNSCQIILDKGDVHGESPKDKKKCQACIDNRAFFYFQQDGYDGSFIYSGWICTDRKCLDAMNRKPESKTGKKQKMEKSEEARESMSASAFAHAAAARDRFLRKEVGAAIEKSQTLKIRLAIFHLVDKVIRDYEIQCRFLADLVPGIQESDLAAIVGDEMYGFIQRIPEQDLGKALQRAIETTVAQDTASGVLFRMMPEAGIEFERDFSLDEEYLNTRTKDELAAIAAELQLSCAAEMANKKKPAMIEAILGCELKGKVPSPIRVVVDDRTGVE